MLFNAFDECPKYTAGSRFTMVRATLCPMDANKMKDDGGWHDLPEKNACRCRWANVCDDALPCDRPAEVFYCYSRDGLPGPCKGAVSSHPWRICLAHLTQLLLTPVEKL